MARPLSLWVQDFILSIASFPFQSEITDLLGHGLGLGLRPEGTLLSCVILSFVCFSPWCSVSLRS